MMPWECLCCSNFLSQVIFIFLFVSTSLAYITITKNKRKTKSTSDKKNLLQHLCWSPGVGSPDFKWQGWSNGGTCTRHTRELPYHKSSDCFEYPKKSHLNQATPQKNRQNFPTQGKPIIKIFLPEGILWSSLSLQIQSSPWWVLEAATKLEMLSFK